MSNKIGLSSYTLEEIKQEIQDRKDTVEEKFKEIAIEMYDLGFTYQELKDIIANA